MKRTQSNILAEWYRVNLRKYNMAELEKMEVRISYGKALKSILFWFALLLGITIGIAFSEVLQNINDYCVKIHLIDTKKY